jgi:SRSO17 transposase
MALAEIRRVREHGVRFGAVLADAGYGACAQFRHALTEMDLRWAVGITSEVTVYSVAARTRIPHAPAMGRPSTRGVPTHARHSAKEMITRLGEKAWQRVSWRNGTKGPLAAEFAAVRIRVADGPETRTRGRVHLPGTQAWLVAERRSDETKYYLTNHPANASLTTLASAIKARWSCEQAHQQLKEELGLDHFEGRSWHGLHHHAVLTLVAFAFLQHQRVAAKKA